MYIHICIYIYIYRERERERAPPMYPPFGLFFSLRMADRAWMCIWRKGMVLGCDTSHYNPFFISCTLFWRNRNIVKIKNSDKIDFQIICLKPKVHCFHGFQRQQMPDHGNPCIQNRETMHFQFSRHETL